MPSSVTYGSEPTFRPLFPFISFSSTVEGEL